MKFGILVTKSTKVLQRPLQIRKEFKNYQYRLIRDNIQFEFYQNIVIF